ncbi:MAG: tetratricopeptide repeat protein [Paracoccaceae bacterium]
MRQSIFVALGLGVAVTVSACAPVSPESEVERALKSINVIDESNLNDIMLAAADPNEAVSYFQRTLGENPNRIDLLRGLAASLVRAKKPQEASEVWARAVAHPESTNEDRVNLADSLIRAGDWDQAEIVLDAVPPTFETFKRYRLEAMIADGNEEWKKADSFYEIAVGLTTQPSGVLNNWGYSKLTRGEYAKAEDLFNRSLKYNSSLFTAKNNLVLARGAQRNYQMPIIQTTQIERAMLLHTLALTAIKQGDVITGKGLLQESINTHPQYFEAAVRSLRALENIVIN